MVREVKNKSLSKKLRDMTSSRFFIPFVILLVVLITVPVIKLLESGVLDFRQGAAPPNPTAIMRVTPSSGDYAVGQTITVTVSIDGGGQAFNGASADFYVSPNMRIDSMSITPSEYGGCGFEYNKKRTPSVSNLSFTGSLLVGSKVNCSLFSVTLTPMVIGSGGIAITRGSVKSASDNKDILLRTENSSFTIVNFLPTNTPVPTSTSSPLPTPTPTPKTIFN